MVKAKPQGQHVTDASGDPKFYVRVPRIIMMKAKNPYYLSFYLAVKDFAGEAGSCYVGTADLAEYCGMSEGMVNEARAFWLESGYIEGSLASTATGWPVWNLVIKNCWEENTTWSRFHQELESRLEYRRGLAEPKRLFKRICKRCDTHFESTGKRARLCPDCQMEATKENDRIHNLYHIRAKSYLQPQDHCAMCAAAEDLVLHLLEDENGRRSLEVLCVEDHDRVHKPIHPMNRAKKDDTDSSHESVHSPHESVGKTDSSHEPTDSSHESKNNIQEDLKIKNNNKKEAIQLWSEDILPALERLFRSDPLFKNLRYSVLSARYEGEALHLVVHNDLQRGWFVQRISYLQAPLERLYPGMTVLVETTSL